MTRFKVMVSRAEQPTVYGGDYGTRDTLVAIVDAEEVIPFIRRLKESVLIARFADYPHDGPTVEGFQPQINDEFFLLPEDVEWEADYRRRVGLAWKEYQARKRQERTR